MGNTKRCSGYKGHWACNEEYPDHMVPVEKFGVNGDGLQGMCRNCGKYRDDIRNAKKDPKRRRHPETNQRRMHWLTARAEEYYGGKPKDPKTDEHWKVCRAKATKDSESIAWVIPNDSQPSNIFSIKRPAKGAPMRKRVGESTLEGDVVPEGWVYVIQNQLAPSVLKIGRTYPDGVESRLAEARRWGEAKLIAQIWFDEVNDAETQIHRILDRYNMRTLGYTEVGKELFKCSLKDFYRAVQQHTLGIEDENAISKS